MQDFGTLLTICWNAYWPFMSCVALIWTSLSEGAGPIATGWRHELAGLGLGDLASNGDASFEGQSLEELSDSRKLVYEAILTAAAKSRPTGTRAALSMRTDGHLQEEVSDETRRLVHERLAVGVLV